MLKRLSRINITPVLSLLNKNLGTRTIPMSVNEIVFQDGVSDSNAEVF